MPEIMWFVIGFTITLIVIAISDTIITCRSMSK